eukprot:TRINITY_DN12587_c0_g1_i13.p1 TRINITY_DN12587_c0_g1~~TRINITY_DN12587_c0_g1_i13.p1  ORF type:complete len:341 (+),score=13.31 TRINITY_DN12587_c0_g1_i13:79-1101(+)
MDVVLLAWLISGCFSISSIIICIITIRQHLLYNSEDRLRKYVVRILGMVPIYSLEAWLGLRFADSAMYFDILRECYEALVIYSFYQFLVTYLGGEDELAVILSKKDVQPHVCPVQYCCKPWPMGRIFIYHTKVGTLQYVIVKPAMALTSFILQAVGKYEEGEFSWSVGYPYVAFINNLSQIWAMYCLVMLYLATYKELAPAKPMPKFLTIKAVVFFTFWQSVAVAVLVKLDVIQRTETYSVDNISKGFQDFAICIEMLIFAIMHVFAFPAKEFHNPERSQRGALLRSLLTITNPLDIVGDVRQTISDTKYLTNRPRDPMVAAELTPQLSYRPLPPAHDGI